MNKEDYSKYYIKGSDHYLIPKDVFIELNKQLENANEQVNYLRRSIERKEERIIDLQEERIPYTNEYVDKLLNQQKDFISYLESEIDRLEKTEFYIDSIQKAAIETHKHNLSKYKEIIGGKDE